MGENSGPKLRRRRVMRRKDAIRLKEEAEALLGALESKTLIQAETEDGTVVYLLDGVIRLVRKGDVLFPTLTNPVVERLPSVVVDMGAIPYVCDGADVMAPGIVEVKGEFDEGALVAVRDIRHGKALAIGLSLTTSEGMRGTKKGKAVKNLHYVGDRLWKALE